MAEFLTFRLYAPLASWGDIAVGGTRPTADHPTRSAILGLVAGAMGFTRDEVDSHRLLDEGLGLAIYAWSTGHLLRDYHTIQTPRQRRGERYRTRAEELNARAVGTVLSQRDYRCDALYDICLWRWPQASGDITLPDIGNALRRPAFAPYLGRKSCPPALPMNPRLIQAADCLEAFRLRHETGDEAAEMERRIVGDITRDTGDAALYWEGDAQTPVRATQTVTRRDRPIDRQRWQFTSREEHFALLPRGE